jgi:hypothetical protein
MATLTEKMLWEMRAFVYGHFATTARPPSVEETAARFALAHDKAASAFEELHRRHAFVLKPGTHEILMANPFSGVETLFKVHANHKTYFANCAWDSLGVPAALHADAQIEAACARTAEPIRLNIKDGEVSTSKALVHFLLPFRDWYNDLGFT